MLHTLKKAKYFIALYILFLIIAGIFLIIFSKSEIHIYLNQLLVPCCNLFFKLITHLGNGLVVAFFIICLLFIKYRYFLIGLISVLITTIIVQSFKRFILPDIVRPYIYFEGKYKLNLVDGVTILTSHSFPSGHSSSAFGMSIMLALMIKNKYWQTLFFILALIISFSRVYLSHHFLNDIYFGSLFSVLTTIIIFTWGEGWKNLKFDNSLRTLFVNKHD